VGKNFTRQNGNENAQPVFRSCRGHALLMTLCNMSEMPDGDEPISKVPDMKKSCD
jgi:hypothetical protein